MRASWISKDLALLAWIGSLAGLLPADWGADALESGFRSPPPEARPWVYWFWLNGNITREGITADLEAMQRTGIGGVLIMEVDQGAPVGPVPFMSADWRSLFQHVASEAQRLGLEVNLNNDAGWNGSGGPWIRPEQSMQKVVMSETNLAGPGRFIGTLPQPPTVAGYYEDIAVLAFPSPGAFRLDRLPAKAAYEVGGVGEPILTNVPPEMAIPRRAVADLTARMGAGGRLEWDIPDGAWTLVRFGHTSTGVENAPAPATGRGLECDKLSREGVEANFNGMMGPMIADVGTAAGRSLVATHVDSWENGSQNWTARMRPEFERRRGYDLLPFLPVFTGRVVDGLEVSERFLWDLRRTISEMVVENYAGHLRDLAHARGLRFTIEAYGGPCDCLPYAGMADEPMGEFWLGGGALETCRGMASAAHVYGKPIVGAEAFTAGDQERWLDHPGSIKSLGDRAFCEGINRFVFHRYALQPWRDRRPGMTMGPWGTHYERTQTWWEETPSWHTYLGRCQFLLRQGLFVADLCYLQPETPPYGFSNHDRLGYDWDECPADVVLNRMTVKDGRLVLPDGMSYRVLVLPGTRTMTPALLRKVGDLVRAGATVLGTRPVKSPSLSQYPECDAEVARLADALWGNGPLAAGQPRKVGAGQIVQGITPEAYLDQAGVKPDFVSPGRLRWIHRQAGPQDLYFVANPHAYAVQATAAFRVSGRAPELWWPESGQIERAPLSEEQAGVTRVVLSLPPSGSVFVVFRQPSTPDDPVVQVLRDGKPLYSTGREPLVRVTVQKAQYGLLDDAGRTRDVRDRVQRRLDAGDDQIRVSELAAGDDPAEGAVKTLAVDYTIDGRTYHVQGQDPDTVYLTVDAQPIQVEKAVYGVLNDPARTRDVRAKVQRILDSGERRFQVARMAAGDDPAFLVVKTLVLEYTRDGQRATIRGTDPEVIDLTIPRAPEAIAEVRRDARHRLVLAPMKPGKYEFRRASGQSRTVMVGSVPESVALAGPWQVRFEAGRGAPEASTFDRLLSWSEHEDRGIRFFSGRASYERRFTLPPGLVGANRRVYLDLGQVGAIARVKLNDRDLGVVWRAPFRWDVTEALGTGENRLAIEVVNLWPNRMLGDEELPEDSERNPDGTLKVWPRWLQAGEPSPSGRVTFTSWRLWKKGEALLESGLLGPVRLQAVDELGVD